jgi:hypothetical protein
VVAVAVAVAVAVVTVTVVTVAISTGIVPNQFPKVLIENLSSFSLSNRGARCLTGEGE